MENEISHTAWGSSPAFPTEEIPVKLLTRQQKVEEDMILILSTKLRKRTSYEAFGVDEGQPLCRVRESFSGNLQKEISKALRLHGPPIKVASIQIATDQAIEGLIVITIQYVLRHANTQHQLVFPFFLNESPY